VIFIQALKKYGIMFADQGSSFYVTGTASNSWDDNFFSDMNDGSNRIPITQFDVVQSPNDVVYGWDATGQMCGSNTQNSQPYVPNWNPVCADFSTTNVVETTTFSSGSSLLLVNIMMLMSWLLLMK